MADTALNDTKGRLAELVNSGSDLQVIPLSAVEADATFEDGYTNPTIAGGSGVLDAAGNTEQTGSTWTRKTHTNANITLTIDDTNDLARVILDNDDTWTAVAASNDVVALLIATADGTDSTDVVIGKWDFSVTTDGNDVTANYDQTNGVWTAG